MRAVCDAVSCYVPLSSCCCMVWGSVIGWGRGEGSGERGSVGQLCEFHSVTTGGSVYNRDELFNCLCLQ